MPIRVPLALSSPRTPTADALQQERETQQVNDQYAQDQDFIAQQQKEQARIQQAQEAAAADAARAQKAVIANAKRAGAVVAPDATGTEQIQRHEDGQPVYQAGFIGTPQVSDKGGAAKYRDARGSSYDVPFDAIRSETDASGETFYNFDVTGPDGSKQTMRQPAGTKPLFRVDPTTGNRLADMTDPATGSVRTQVVGIDRPTASKAAIAKRRDALQLRQNEISGQAEELRLQRELKDTLFTPVKERFNLAQDAHEKINKAKIRYEQRPDTDGKLALHQVHFKADGEEEYAMPVSNDPQAIASAQAWIDQKKRADADFAAAKAEHDPAKTELQTMDEQRARLAINILDEKRRAEKEIRVMDEAAKAGQPVYEPEWQKRFQSILADPRVQDNATIADLEDAGDPLAEDVKRVSRPASATALNAALEAGIVSPKSPLVVSRTTDTKGMMEDAPRAKLVDTVASGLTAGKPATVADSKAAKELAAKSLGMQPDGVEVSGQKPEGHYELTRNGAMFATLDPRNNRLTLLDTPASLQDKGAEIIANASPDGVPVYMVSSEQPFRPAEVRDLIQTGINAARNTKTELEAEQALADVGLDSAGIRQKVMAGKLSVQDGKMLNEKLNNVQQVNATATAVQAEFGKFLTETPILAEKYRNGTREQKAEVVNLYMDGFAAKAGNGVVIDRSLLAQRRAELLAATDERGAISKAAGFTGGAIKSGIASLAGIGYWMLRAPDRAMRLVGGTDDEGTNLVYNQSRDLVQRLAGENAPWNKDSGPMGATLGEVEAWANRADSVDDMPDELADKLAEQAFTNYHGFSAESAADVETSRDTFNVKKNPQLRPMLENYLKTGNGASFQGIYSMLKQNARERQTAAEVQKYIERPRAATPAAIASRASLLGIQLDPAKATAALNLSKQLEEAKDEKQAAAVLKQAATVLGLENPDHAALALSEISREETTDPESWTGMFRGASVAGIEEVATEVVSDVALAALSATVVGAPEAVALKGAQVAAKQGIRGALNKGFQRLVTHNLDSLANRSAKFAKIREVIGKGRTALGNDLRQMGDDFQALGIRQPKFGQALTTGQKAANLAVGTIKATVAGAPIEALEEGLTAVLSNDPSAAAIGDAMLQGAIGVGGITPVFAGVQGIRNAFTARGQAAKWEKVKGDYIAKVNESMAKNPGFKPLTVADFDAWQGLQESPEHKAATAEWLTAKQAFDAQVNAFTQASRGSPAANRLRAIQSRLAELEKQNGPRERPIKGVVANGMESVRIDTTEEKRLLDEQAKLMDDPTSADSGVTTPSPSLLAAKVALETAHQNLAGLSQVAFEAMAEIRALAESERVLYTAAAKAAAGATDYTEAEAKALMQQSGANAVIFQQAQTLPANVQGPAQLKNLADIPNVTTAAPGVYRLPDGVRLNLPQPLVDMLAQKSPSMVNLMGRGTAPATAQGATSEAATKSTKTTKTPTADATTPAVTPSPTIPPELQAKLKAFDTSTFTMAEIDLVDEVMGDESPFAETFAPQEEEAPYVGLAKELADRLKNWPNFRFTKGKEKEEEELINSLWGVSSPFNVPKSFQKAKIKKDSKDVAEFGQPKYAQALPMGERIDDEVEIQEDEVLFVVENVVAREMDRRNRLAQTRMIRLADYQEHDGGMKADPIDEDILINVTRLARSAWNEANLKGGTITRRDIADHVALTIDHEVVHIAQIKAAHNIFDALTAQERQQQAGTETEPTFWEWVKGHYGRVWREEFTAEEQRAVITAYGSILATKDEWIKAFEAFRMLVQTGSKGRLSEAVLRHLQGVLVILKRWYADLKGDLELRPVIKAEIEGIEAVLADAENPARAFSEEWAAQASDQELSDAQAELAANAAEWAKDEGMSQQTKVGIFNAQGILGREAKKRATPTKQKNERPRDSQGTSDLRPKGTNAGAEEKPSGTGGQISENVGKVGGVAGSSSVTPDREVQPYGAAEVAPKTPKSSTQFTLSPADAKPILDFGASIPKDELFTSIDPEWSDGALETEPHVTVLYGLTKHEAAPVAKAIKDHGPVTVTLGKLSIFENGEYDVLKIDVEGPELRSLNAKLSKLPNENSFPDYRPHMTIAYLKKGEGKKYVGDTRFEGQTITFNTMTFSPPSELRGELGKPELPLSQSPVGVPETAPDAKTGSPASDGAVDGVVEGIGSVYQTIHNGKPQWAVQTSEKRGFGDYLFDTQDEANKAGAIERMNRESRAKSIAEAATRERDEAEKKAAQEKDPRAYAKDAGMSQVSTDRAVSVLVQPVSRRSQSASKIYTGTKAEVAAQMVADGYVPKKRDDGFTFEQGDGDSIFKVTKIEHDFAVWLVSQKPTPDVANTTAEAPKVQDSAENAPEAGDKELGEAFSGLFSAPSQTAWQDADPPQDKDRRDKMIKAATALMDAGVNKPEQLAARLEKLAPNGQLRKYSRFFWRLMSSFDSTLAESPDWQAIYAEIDQSAEVKEDRDEANRLAGIRLEERFNREFEQKRPKIEALFDEEGKTWVVKNGKIAKPGGIQERWTPDELKQMVAKFRDAGLAASVTGSSGQSMKSTFALIDTDSQRMFGIVMNERAARAGAAAKRDAQQQEQAKKQGYLAEADQDALQWMNQTFGEDFANEYNKKALSDFLTGKAAKFSGMVSQRWTDGVKALGAIADAEKGTVDFAAIKKAYNASKAVPEQGAAPASNSVPVSEQYMNEINRLLRKKKAAMIAGNGDLVDSLEDQIEQLRATVPMPTQAPASANEQDEAISLEELGDELHALGAGENTWMKARSPRGPKGTSTDDMPSRQDIEDLAKKRLTDDEWQKLSQDYEDGREVRGSIIATEAAPASAKVVTPEMIASKVEELLRAPTKTTKKPAVAFGSQTEERAFKSGFEAATQKQGKMPPPEKTGLSPKDRKWDDAWRKGWASGQTFVRSLPDTPATAEAKVEEQVQTVAATEGQRDAKEIKKEILQRLHEALQKLADPPQFRWNEPKTKGGKREVVIVEGDSTLFTARQNGYGWDVFRGITATNTTFIGHAGETAINRAKPIIESLIEADKLPKGTKPLTFKIPGDGTFTVTPTHASINEMIRRVEGLETKFSANRKPATMLGRNATGELEDWSLEWGTSESSVQAQQDRDWLERLFADYSQDAGLADVGNSTLPDKLTRDIKGRHTYDAKLHGAAHAWAESNDRAGVSGFAMPTWNQLRDWMTMRARQAAQSAGIEWTPEAEEAPESPEMAQPAAPVQTREEAAESARTAARQDPSIPPPAPAELETLQALRERANRRGYKPSSLTPDRLDAAVREGWVTKTKEAKLTEKGYSQLNEWERQQNSHESALGALSDKLVDDAISKWDRENDPTSWEAINAANQQNRTTEPAAPAVEEIAPTQAATRKPRTPKKPTLFERLQAYFVPGAIVDSYGGKDRVIALYPDGGIGQGGWSVEVVSVDKDGKDTPGARVRRHSTLPSEKALQKAWQDRAEAIVRNLMPKEQAGKLNPREREAIDEARMSLASAPAAQNAEPSPGGLSKAEVKTNYGNGFYRAADGDETNNIYITDEKEDAERYLSSERKVRKYKSYWTRKELDLLSMASTFAKIEAASGVPREQYSTFPFEELNRAEVRNGLWGNGYDSVVFWDKHSDNSTDHLSVLIRSSEQFKPQKQNAQSRVENSSDMPGRGPNNFTTSRLGKPVSSGATIEFQAPESGKPPLPALSTPSGRLAVSPHRNDLNLPPAPLRESGGGPQSLDEGDLQLPSRRLALRDNPQSVAAVNPESSRAAGGPLASSPARQSQMLEQAAATLRGEGPPLAPGLRSMFNPQARRPATGERGLFDRPKDQLADSIQKAYRAVQMGQSTVMVPIRAVFQRLKAANPALTVDEYLAAIQAADQRGDVMLEAANTTAEQQANAPFVVPSQSGPGVRMAWMDNRPPQVLASAPSNSPQTPTQKAIYEIRQQLNAADAGRSEYPIPEERLRAQAKSLLQWAASAKRIIDRAELERATTRHAGLGGGEEHDVWHDAGRDRVVKLTKPGAYGIQQDLTRYLDTIEYSNRVFGDDIVIEGVVFKDGWPHILISQPFYRGEMLTQPEIDGYFEGMGAQSTGRTASYLMPDGARVYDAKPRNVFTLTNGSIQPIDVQVALASAPARSVTAAQDAEYMAAVEAGDMETAQVMVDAAAKAVGGVKVWHGGNIEGDVIDTDRRERGAVSERRSGTFFGSTSKEVAKTYPGKTNSMFFFLRNPFRISTPVMRPASWTGETAVKTDKGVANRKSSLSIGEAIDRAKTNGYDGVVYENIIDVGRNFAALTPPIASTVVAFSPNQIKSADPVTRDKAGNVIPPSQRFNPQADSILYSAPSKETAKQKQTREILESMPPIWRDVLQDQWNNKSIEDIAAARNLSLVAVGNILRRSGGLFDVLMKKAAAAIPEVAVEDGIVKAAYGRPDLARSGDALMAALDQNRPMPEVVHRAEMEDLAGAMFSGWPTESLAIVKRWMDSGGMMTVPDNLPHGLKVILDEASARGAAPMLMQVAANHALNQARLNNAPLSEQMRLGLAWRELGTEQARAFGARQDTFHDPMERHALYIQKMLTTPQDGDLKTLLNNPASRSRILAEMERRAEDMKRRLKAAGYDLDAWFAEQKAVATEAASFMPPAAAPQLKRLPRKVQHGINAWVAGAKLQDAAREAGMTAQELHDAYADFYAAVNQEALKAAVTAKDEMLRSAPAPNDFAAQIGLPPPPATADPNARLNDTPKARAYQARRENAALNRPTEVAAAMSEMSAGQSGFIGKMAEYWRMSILSGPQTWVVNASSGLALGMYRNMVQKLGTAGLASIVRATGMADLPNAPALSDIGPVLQHAWDSFVPSLKNAFRSWKHNRRLYDAYAKGNLTLDPGGKDWDFDKSGIVMDGKEVVFKGEKYGPALSRDKWWKLGAIMDVISFRMLLIADEFVRSWFGRIETAAQLRQMARSEPALKKRTEELRAEIKKMLPTAWELRYTNNNGYYAVKPAVVDFIVEEGQNRRVEKRTIMERVGAEEWSAAVPAAKRDSLATNAADLALHGGFDALLTDKATPEQLKARLDRLGKPGSGAWMKGVEAANTITAQSELGTGVRAVDAIDGLADLIQRGKTSKYALVSVPMQFLFPFVATPVNLFKTGITMSPVGGFLALIDAVRSYRRRKAGDLEGARKIMDAARALEEIVNQTVAWGLVLTLSELMEPDDDEEDPKKRLPRFTGTGEWKALDAGERQLAYKTAPPLSFRIGDRWFSYRRLDPFAIALANIADGIDAFKKEPTEKALFTVGVRAIDAMEEKTFLAGAADAMNLIRDPERYGPRWAANIATGFIPNLIRQPVRSADEQFRDKDIPANAGFLEKLERHIGYSIIPQFGPEKLDLWGRNVEKDTDTFGPLTDTAFRLLSPVGGSVPAPDALDVALYTFNLENAGKGDFGIEAPERRITRTIAGQKIVVDLTDEERANFIRQAGSRAHATVTAQYGGRKLTLEDVDNIREIVRKVYSVHRDAAFVAAVQKRGGVNSLLANTRK